jgi:hypothetical protein
MNDISTCTILGAPAASNLKPRELVSKAQKKMSSKPPATPMSRVDLRNLVREADDRLKLQARAEAREGGQSADSRRS